MIAIFKKVQESLGEVLGSSMHAVDLLRGVKLAQQLSISLKLIPVFASSTLCIQCKTVSVFYKILKHRIGQDNNK